MFDFRKVILQVRWNFMCDVYTENFLTNQLMINGCIALEKFRQRIEDKFVLL